MIATLHTPTFIQPVRRGRNGARSSTEADPRAARTQRAQPTRIIRCTTDQQLRPCMLVLSLAVVVGAIAPEALLNSGKIEHFVVLYMENRVRARARELLRDLVLRTQLRPIDTMHWVPQLCGCSALYPVPRCMLTAVFASRAGVRPLFCVHEPARGRQRRAAHAAGAERLDCECDVRQWRVRVPWGRQELHHMDARVWCREGCQPQPVSILATE